MKEENNVMIQEHILPYKLEQHLIEVCNNSAYTNLLSVWNINKKMCQDVLSTVILNYPHYTKHDISHCEAIITNIEMLLGEEAIKALSPTDTWLLLHAAYLHDLGMAIENRKIEENWDSKEFQEYLHELEYSNDESLALNVQYINSLGDKLEKKQNLHAWPVRVRYAVTLIIAEYYRRQHAEDSNSYIKDMGYTFHIDLGSNGLIQQRLIMLLADIVCLHTESNQKILELDYQTNGFNADYAHPRFLAQMLRMGDLLDADSNRFNMANETVFGEIPGSSKKHWEKHVSARHILITPDIIEYRADCNELDVYRETRIFVSWLKEEVEFWTLNWKSIMPETMKGGAPKLGKCELFLNGVPDIQGLSDLRFSISPEKAFEVIEGTNIYENHFVFLREVIQNALDACKIQLWRDISQGRYKSWISHTNKGEIQPYEIEQAVYDNYTVEIRLYNYDEHHLKVIIKDNGIGLSVEQLKKICDVGVSYSGDKKRRKEINNMPLWLRPTAGFGIGLQSIFLVTEEFEIYSKASVEEGIYARVASRRRNGYVQITKSNELKSQGTEIHIIVSRDLEFKFGISSNTDQYITQHYDPFSAENNLLYYKIWDVIRENMKCTYFPVELYFDDNLIDTVSAQVFDRLEGCAANGRYMFSYLDGFGMELWDVETCTRIRIRIQEKYQLYNNRYFFKGMEIKPDFSFNIKGVQFNVDFYGLDTKRTLALDRKRVRKEALETLYNIVNSSTKFFLDMIEEKLFENKQTREESEYNKLYTYWCIVLLEKKLALIKNYSNIFNKIEVKIDVLKKKDDNKFYKEQCDFKEVVCDLTKMAIIKNLDSYIEYKSFVERVNENLVIRLLNQGDVSFSVIIIDRHFIEAFDYIACSKLLIVSDGENRLDIMSYANNANGPLELANKETKDYLLKSLLQKNDLAMYYTFPRGSERRCIMGIKEYAPLCTDTVPFGIGGNRYSHEGGYIISPVTISKWNSANHQEVSDFVNDVCSCKEFYNLVDYVYLHQIQKEQFSKNDIIETYKNLTEEIYNVNKAN